MSKINSKSSLYRFLESLIDYAGLFPPANLSLDAAIKNYSNYLSGENKWILGPFVIPITIIDRLQDYASFFKENRPYFGEKIYLR